MSDENVETPAKKRRGFASMSPERVREIASKGGRAVHAQGKGHRFTHEEAKAAGAKGGAAPHKRRGRAKQYEPTKRPTAADRTGFLPMPYDSEVEEA